MQTEEPKTFYVGWMPKADEEYRRFIRLAVFTLAVICIFTAGILVTNQREFSSGVYERNQLTELEGILVQQPCPAIRAYYGKDIHGNPLIKTIPLVSKGKFGADASVSKVIGQSGSDPAEVQVKVQGRLIYNRGSALLELANGEHSIQPVAATGKSQISPAEILKLGTATLHGEIVDPKCYLGVMKPGAGKPHNDCAIRCIAGGIPPVLRIQNSSGDETLILLKGKNNESVNRQVLSYVGLPVSVTGEMVRMDDWLAMTIDPSTAFKKE